MSKCRRSCSKQVFSIPNIDVLWFSELVYASVESCRADWHAADGGEAADNVTEEAEVRSAHVRDIGDFSLSLEKDAG